MGAFKMYRKAIITKLLLSAYKDLQEAKDCKYKVFNLLNAMNPQIRPPSSTGL